MSLEKKLYQLFLVDQQVRGLRERLDTAERRRKAQQLKRERLAQQHAEVRDQHKRVQAVVHDLETQVQGIEDRITVLREQMNSVRNNKEYAALLVEVNTLKADKGKIEDQAIEHLTKAEELNAQINALQAEIDQQDKLLELAAAEVKAATEEIGDQLDKLNGERAVAAGEVPQDALAEFDRLAKLHDGEALARVVEEDRRRMEYTCSGCYMGLPIERVSALMRNANVLSYCPSCGRILHLDTELRDAFAAKS